MTLSEAIVLWVCLMLLLLICFVLLVLNHRLSKMEFDISRIRDDVQRLQNQLAASTDITVSRVDRLSVRLVGDDDDKAF